ncbi:MAG: PIN domain-containing protein [Bryobacterales bacterium]|nr:PIN domain-containing protein [Bryobacterales bacterium]
MTARAFVDSNIYASDPAAGSRHAKAADKLKDLWRTQTGCLSTQVLGVPAGAAREAVRHYAAWVRNPLTPATVIRARELSEAWQLSFWDALILAAAEQDGATELITEDLNHGQVIAGIRIVNPFL